MDCLAYMHANLQNTGEVPPVRPVVEYPWDDLRYSDELDAAAGLDSVQYFWTLTDTSRAAPRETLPEFPSSSNAAAPAPEPTAAST